MISHFKTTLKNGLKLGAIYFQFSCKQKSAWTKEDGKEHQEDHEPWTAEQIVALFTQFFPDDLEAIQAGKPTRGVLTVLSHGNLILLAQPGDEPKLEIFVPPHAEAKFEEAWRKVQEQAQNAVSPAVDLTPSLAEPHEIPVPETEGQFVPPEIADGIGIALSAPPEENLAIEVKKGTQSSEPSADASLNTGIGHDNEGSNPSTYDVDEALSHSIPLTALSGDVDFLELPMAPLPNEEKVSEKTGSAEDFSISHTQVGLNIWSTPTSEKPVEKAAVQEEQIPPPPPPPPVSANRVQEPPVLLPTELGEEAPVNPFTLPSIEQDQAPEPAAAELKTEHPSSHAFAQLIANLTQPGWWECFGLAGSPVFVRHDTGVERQMRTWPAQAELEEILLQTMPTFARKQWQEHGEVTFCYGSQIRHRVRATRSHDTIHVTARALSQPMPTWEQLGIPESVRRLTDLGRGLVLVCGPSNSGRSTTLAALLNHITKYRKAHVQTLEQPVEYVIDSSHGHVWQQEVNLATLPHLLRKIPLSSPDVVMVSDVNQPRVLREALNLAEKGHLVFAGFTANTSVHAIERMVDLFPPTEQVHIRNQIADNLRGVVAQLLLQKRSGGRIPAFDVLIMNKSSHTYVREGKINLIGTNVQSKKTEGHALLHESIMTLVQNGTVDSREAFAKAPDRDTLQSPAGKKSGNSAA